MASYYSYHRSTPPPAPPTHRPHRLRILGTVVIIGMVGVMYYHSQKHKTGTVAAAPATSHAALSQNISADAISDIIHGDSDDDIGVAVENIATGKLNTYGDTTPFTAASTTKVLSAVAYYHLVEQGQLSLSTVLGAYPVSYQLELMVNDSDNDSWQLIDDAIGTAARVAYAQSIGLNYDADDNTLSAADMAKLLGQLYAGKLLNPQHTAQLLSYMQHTNNETMIPAAVPASLTVYHKYGELDTGELHDAAIISNGKTAYAVVIYTTGNSSVSTRTAIIKQLASAVISTYHI